MEKPNNNARKFPKGYFPGLWMGIGIAMFSGVGVPLSIVTGNHGLIGIGPALGVSVGLAIGQGIENKYEKQGKIRPLTPAEQRTRKRLVWAGLGLFLIGILLFLWFFLYKT